MTIDKDSLIESMVYMSKSADRKVRVHLIDCCHEHLTDDLIEKLSLDVSSWVRCTLRAKCYDRMTDEQKKRSVFGSED